jgi:hypothetical protein
MENDMNVRTASLTRFLAAAGSLAFAACLGLVLGCSTAVSPSASTIVTGAVSTVPVIITDAPSDQLVSFSLTLNSITLTDSAGKTASILSTPTTVEICHLNGIEAPLVTASIPQDTYVSAILTFSNPEITYINSSGQPVVASPTLATTSFTFTFPTPFIVSNSSTSLLIDLLAGQSVAISGTTVTVTPIFSLKPVPPATAAPPMGQNGTGMEQHGTVVSASGTTLVISPGSGANVSFTTNSATSFQGVSSLTALTAGELVDVDFTVQTGGVLLATRVQLCPPPPNGAQANLLTGPVTSITPGTSFNMVLMQGLGPAVGPVSSTAVPVFTVTTNTSTVWAITPQFISLTGLPFTPSFSPTNLTDGQTVGVVTSSVTGNTAVAANVYLVPQTVDGTVTAIATAGNYTAYTYNLASGSAFGSLSGATTLTVYTGTATAGPVSTMAPPAIAVGSTVRFNGLIFNLGAGKFAMVAGVCPDGAPGI